MQLFKYFPNHERFTPFERDLMKCIHCHLAKKCMELTDRDFDELEEGICLECLSTGVIKNYGLVINRDYENANPLYAPVEAMRRYHPNKKDLELRMMFVDSCNILAYATPKLVSWQGEVGFPFIEGDFAQFLGFASKEDYIELSNGIDTLNFYKSSLNREANEELLKKLWTWLPDNKVQSFEEGNRLIVTSYLFKSLSSDKIMTTFDMT